MTAFGDFQHIQIRLETYALENMMADLSSLLVSM